MRKHKRRVKLLHKIRQLLGFTLVELLVVIGILSVLLSITIIAINPFEQYNRSQDTKAKISANQYIDSVVSYFSFYKTLPWKSNNLCNDEISSNKTLADMPNCLHEIIKSNKVEEGYLKGDEFKHIYLSKCADSAVLCYNPQSKIDNLNAETKYTKFGVNDPGCPGSGSNECYWCRPVLDTPGCKLGSISPTLTPTLTTTPTPVSNPWGQAAVFSGKVAGLNPPSFTPILEFVKVDYTPIMNLTSPNLTVEAWIKPKVPTAAGYHYRIVDSTYRLTMVAQPNGQNVMYQYYFDVQSSTNGCGQTVVYSGKNNPNPWDPSNYKTVSHAEFNTWKHIAGVLQNGNLHIYENGVKLNSYNINMSVCNDGRSIHVGAGLFGKSTPYYDYFQGAIDEVRVSTDTRYTANFTPQKQPFETDSQTLFLYHFNNNSNDSSANHLNGQIAGNVKFEESDIPY